MRILIPLTLAVGCTPGDYWYFRTSGVDIPVRVEGNLDSGVVLVMLHGGPGGSAVDYNFGLDAELLEDAYAVAYYDQRGQGGTHGSYDISQYTVQQVADDNANLVRAIRARYGDSTSVWLYGHSWGGMLGTATIIDTDADVDGWIESAGSHDYPLNDIYTAEMLVEVGQQEIDNQSAYTSDWRSVIKTVERITSDDEIGGYESVTLNIMAYEAEDYVDIIEGDAGEESWLSVLLRDPTNRSAAWLSGLNGGDRLNRDAQQTSYTDRLSEITVPSLFLYGEMDFICPPQLGRDAHERVDTDATEFHLFEKAGHSLMVSHPQDYAETIIQFVEKWR